MPLAYRRKLSLLIGMQTQCSSTSSSCCERVNKLGINISRRPVTLVRSSASYTTQSSPMAETAGIKAVPALPATFKRLVAKTSGNSFTEVAQVVEMPMVMPGPGEVRDCKIGTWHNSCVCTRQKQI